MHRSGGAQRLRWLSQSVIASRGDHMLDFLKRLLPHHPLPSHLHVHFDDAGDEVLCDASICRPPQPQSYLYRAPR